MLFRAALVLIVCATGVFPQQPAGSPQHRAAQKLVEALGMRDQMSRLMGPLLEGAGKQMAVRNVNGATCNDEFVVEWKKRMSQQLTPDRFIEVVVPIYERHFTLAELEELTAIRVAAGQGKKQDPSQPLAQKMQQEAVDLQSEVIGATSQLGAKVGGEVGKAIEKEHPGWCGKH